MGQMDRKAFIEDRGIDEETFNELLGCFATEVEEELAKLAVAAGAGDYATIARVGHGLKGMAGNLRLTLLQDMGKEIEAIGKEGKDAPAIQAKIAAFKQGMEELKG